VFEGAINRKATGQLMAWQATGLLLPE